MKGEYRVQVRSKKVNYDFTVRRNITLIRGDSGTGKSTLIQLLQSAERSKLVQVNCKAPYFLPVGRNWKRDILELEDTIVFLDEDNRYITTKDFASVIKQTSNYYVIITRSNLEMLPYSMGEIYGVKNSNIFNEFKPLFNLYNESIVPDYIVTEDSKSGYEFFLNLSKNSKARCVSSHGNSNIIATLL